jgi:hypothetical protein
MLSLYSAGAVGDHADDSAVHKAVLLRQVIAHRQLDRAAARLDGRHLGPDQRHRGLARERVADAPLEIGVAGDKAHRAGGRQECSE